MGKQNWSIEEIIDFEACMHRFSDDVGGDQLIRSNVVAPLLEEKGKLTKSKKKKIAFREWKKHRLKEYAITPSEVWRSSRQTVSVLLVILGLFFGASSVIAIVDWQDQSLNIGLLIGVSVLLPAVLLITSLLFLIIGKGKVGTAVVVMRWIVKKLSIKLEKRGVKLPTPIHSLEKPLKLSCFNIVQKASMAYGFGSVLAIICLVFFLEMQFYWESSVANQMSIFWYKVTHWLATPWKLFGFAVISQQDVLAIQKKGGELTLDTELVHKWAYFLILCVITWGLLPRLLMYLFGEIIYARTLANVEFEEKRHRQLWRRLYVQPVQTEHVEAEDDGAVCLDYGGIGVKTEMIRPFVLQRLRLNPSKIQQVATMDVEAEQAAYKMIAEKAQPVLLCCEATEFSPKSLEAVIRKIKFHSKKEEMIHILLIGDNVHSPPSEDSVKQWKDWINEMGDTEVDLTVVEVKNGKEQGGRE